MIGASIGEFRAGLSRRTAAPDLGHASGKGNVEQMNGEQVAHGEPFDRHQVRRDDRLGFLQNLNSLVQPERHDSTGNLLSLSDADEREKDEPSVSGGRV